MSSLIIVTNSELVFERIKPVLWLATDSRVSGGLLEYDINFAFTDPCKVYSKHIENNPPIYRDIDEDDKTIMKSFEDNCKALYHLEWIKEMDQLLAVDLPDHHLDQPPERAYSESTTRTKREVIYYRDLLKHDNDTLEMAHKRQRIVVHLALENYAKQTNQSNSWKNDTNQMNLQRLTQLIEEIENYALSREGTFAQRYLHKVMKQYILADEVKYNEVETSKGKLFVEYMGSVKGVEFASLIWDVIRDGKNIIKNRTKNVIDFETKRIRNRLDELRSSKDPRSMVRTFVEFLEAKRMTLSEALIISEVIWPTGPLKLVSLAEKHVRRDITGSNYLQEGESEEPATKYAWWEPFAEFVLGPIWTITRPYSPRSRQLNRTLSRLMTFHEKITNSEITEKFLFGFAKVSFRSTEFELDHNAIDPNVYTSYKWYEYFAFLAPYLRTYIYEVARERTLLEFIDKWKDKITTFLNSDHLQQYLSSIIKDDSLSKFEYEISDTTLERPKRQILSGLIVAGAGAAGKEIFSYFMANVATNLIQSIFDWISPNSNSNRITKSEVMLKDFNDNFKANQIVDRGILDNLDKLSNIVQLTAQKVELQTRRLPEYSWLSALIINRISLAGLDLQRVTDEARRGRIAAAPLGRLLGIPELRQLDASDTKLLSISKVSNNTVNFRFRAVRTSLDTKVYKVYPFDHWDNLDEIPRLMKYKGKQYLIYNSTSNCIKSLDSAPDNYIGDQCSRLNGDDPALAQWEIIKETEDLNPFKSQSQVVKTLNGNYIYCFPGYITVQGHNYTCPMDPFRLDVNREFQTADQLHIPNFVTLNASREYISATEVMHAGFFRDDSDTVQPLALFEALRQERKLLREQNYTLNHSFVVDKTNAWFWTFITLNVGLTIGVSTILFIKVCCTQQQKHYRDGMPMAPLESLVREESFRRPYNHLTEPLTNNAQTGPPQNSISPPPSYNPFLKR